MFHIKYLCITEKSLDFLLITETWLREKAHELAITEITPPGFTFSHRPSVSGRGGGIDLIYKQSIIVRTRLSQILSVLKTRTSLYRTKNRQYEWSACIVRPPPFLLQKKNRPTNATFDEEFGKLACTISPVSYTHLRAHET